MRLTVKSCLRINSAKHTRSLRQSPLNSYKTTQQLLNNYCMQWGQKNENILTSSATCLVPVSILSVIHDNCINLRLSITWSLELSTSTWFIGLRAHLQLPEWNSKYQVQHNWLNFIVLYLILRSYTKISDYNKYNISYSESRVTNI